MLDDGCIEGCFYLVFEVVFYLTGEAIIWVFTLGRHRPMSRKRRKLELPGASSHAGWSFFVGFLFWVFVGLGITALL
jgi:hypothetical protein